MLANIIIAIALLTVLGTLILGMLNMRKTGLEARMKSNKLMRIRVMAQAVAVGALFLMLYLKSQGSA
jgi:hypothetical protein